MLDYDRKLIKHNQELEYQKRRKVVDLINIYEGKINKIGTKIGKTNPLSKNWYESKRKSNLIMLEQITANTEKFFRTVSKTNSEDNMYTVFKSYTKYIKGKGYSKGFVPCNARGTNECKDKKALAYLVNFFMSPEIRQFVNHYDLIFDEDMCSLSALLQWMWRSQIRNGKPIDIYIPSERMRELLNNWIQNCYVTEKAAYNKNVQNEHQKLHILIFKPFILLGFRASFVKNKDGKIIYR